MEAVIKSVFNQKQQTLPKTLPTFQSEQQKSPQLQLKKIQQMRIIYLNFASCFARHCKYRSIKWTEVCVKCSILNKHRFIKIWSFLRTPYPKCMQFPKPILISKVFSVLFHIAILSHKMKGEMKILNNNHDILMFFGKQYACAIFNDETNWKRVVYVGYSILCIFLSRRNFLIMINLVKCESLFANEVSSQFHAKTECIQ